MENNTWQSHECTAVVKIESTTTTIREIKTEPLEDCEENIENPELTNLSTNLSTNIHNAFNCESCYEIFEDFEMLFVHRSLYHQIKPYVCDLCGERFSLSLHLNIHVAGHVNSLCSNNLGINDIESSSRPYWTRTCNNHRALNYLRASSNNGLTNVQYQNLCEKKVSVLASQNYFASNSNTFLQNINECKPFKCPNCLFSSASENEFLNHHKVCNINFDNSYVPKNRHFHCHLCTKLFTNQASLNEHMVIHSIDLIPKKLLKKNKSQKKPVKVFKCKTCNKNFVSRRKLNIHYKQHNKQMICKICHKQFFLEKAFEKHLLKHENITVKKDNRKNTSFNESHAINDKKSTKQKSFKVKFCTQKITDDKKLQKNSLKKIDKFHCLYCNKYYKSTKSLCEHKRRYHAHVKPKVQRLASVKCNWCNAVITKCNLMRHINSLHPHAKPFKCTHCTMKFKSYSSMKSHIKDSHKN